MLRNTVIVRLLRLAFGFPAPIILARKIVQSVSYLPHCLSGVALAGTIVEVPSPQRRMVGVIFRVLDRPAPVLLSRAKLSSLTFTGKEQIDPSAVKSS